MREDPRPSSDGSEAPGSEDETSGAGASPPSPAKQSAPADPAEQSEAPPRRGPPPNPLYHPLFLPVLLVAYCLWFGYDGFLSAEDYEHRSFNQVMFAITAALSLWVVPRGIREWQADRAAAGDRQSGGSGAGSPRE